MAHAVIILNYSSPYSYKNILNHCKEIKVIRLLFNVFYYQKGIFIHYFSVNRRSWLILVKVWSTLSFTMFTLVDYVKRKNN